MRKLLALILTLILSLGMLAGGTFAEENKTYRVALIVKSLSEAYATWLADSVLNQAASHEEFANLDITVDVYKRQFHFCAYPKEAMGKARST